MKTLLVIFSFCVFCCSPNQDAKNMHKNDGILSEKVSPKIDSLKWMSYSLNFYGKAIFYDTIERSKDTITPVECEVALNEVREFSSDSIYYYFSFVKPSLIFKYLNIGGVD